MSFERTRVSRVLLVVEAIRDGVYSQIRNLVRQFHAQRPDAILDLCYSSAHASAQLPGLLDQIRKQGGQVLDLEVGRAPSLKDFGAIQKLSNLIRTTKPDVIHAHSSKAGGLVRLLAIGGRGFPPVIYTPHAYFGMAARGVAGHVFNTVEKVLSPFALTTTCSPDERQFALSTLKIPARRLIFLNHGLDLAQFQPATADERVQLRTELGLPHDKLILASVGRVSFQKNYEPLYGALADLSHSGTRFLFIHAGKGSGSLAKKLPSRASQSVITHEHFTETAKLVRAADAFILTSRFEGLSIAVLEALACGLQTILTRVPGSACLAGMNFRSIRWLEPSEEPGVLQERILEALRELNDSRPKPPDLIQARRVDELFNEARQFGKLFKLYDYAGKRAVKAGVSA